MEAFLTVLQFFFIKDSNRQIPSELKFEIGSDKEKYELDKDNCISFNSNYPKSNVYYCEQIKLKYKNKVLFSFQFLIYIGKTNNIIIDLDEKDERPSFELLFYSKDIKFMPKCLKYKNKKYEQFQNYENKYRFRIFFANVDPTKLEYINSEKMNQYNWDFNNNETYHVLFRISDFNTFEISMANMNSYFEKEIYLPGKKIALSKSEYETLRNMLTIFYNKYETYRNLNSDIIEQKNKAYSDLKKYSEKITSNESYDFIDNPETYEYGTFSDELLYLFHLDYYLNEFIKLSPEDEASETDNFESQKVRIMEYHSMEEKLFNQLNKDINLDIYQKVKILRTVTIYLNNTVLIPQKILGVDFINIQYLSEDSPYFKSIKMLNKIISEITEESRLFEAFMYFDSEIIENILIENSQKTYEYRNIFGQKVQIKQPQYITEYGMSLMTVEEIKEHLFNLLPTIIVQIDSNLDFRASFEKKTRIMIINEYQVFGNFIADNKNFFKVEPDSYVVPISMEMLSEIFGNIKLRYNNKDESSPLALRDSKNDFKCQKLMTKIKLNLNKEILINKGETGRVLEHYISENKNVIGILKKKPIIRKLLIINFG